MTNARERLAWWSERAHILTALVDATPDYLPATSADDSALDWQAAEQIKDALAGARAAADLAVGAYTRVCATLATPQEADAAPAPAVVRPAQTSGWAAARATGRGWTS